MGDNDITAALRAEDDIGFGTVKFEQLSGGVGKLPGFIVTGPFESTDTPAVVVWLTDDETPEGEVTEQVLMPLRRVLRIVYDREQIEAGL